MSFETHYSRNVWTDVSDEVLKRKYGEEEEYGLDQLRDDLESEGVFLEDGEVEEALDVLTEELPVTGEDIEETLEDYSAV